jgi:cytohesin
VTDVLLQNGANPNLPGGKRDREGFKYEYTPLHLAAREGHADIVRALCEGGAHPDLPAGQARGGATPYNMAATEKVRKVLREHGAGGSSFPY